MMPSLIKETLLVWYDLGVAKKHRKAWYADPLCLFWTVWKTRNRIAFEDKELSIQRLESSFVGSLWLETKGVQKEVSYLLLDFFSFLIGNPVEYINRKRENPTHTRGILQAPKHQTKSREKEIPYQPLFETKRKQKFRNRKRLKVCIKFSPGPKSMDKGVFHPFG